MWTLPALFNYSFVRFSGHFRVFVYYALSTLVDTSCVRLFGLSTLVDTSRVRLIDLSTFVDTFAYSFIMLCPL